MFKNTDSGNTTQYSRVNLNIKYEQIIRPYTFQYDTYLSVIFKQAATDFGIPETDRTKYELRLNDIVLFKSARLFDIQDVKEGCVIAIHEK
jgi:hypothetical protein